MNTLTAHWHKRSYTHFVQTLLPELLAKRLPLAGYTVDDVNTYQCQIQIAVGRTNGKASAVYILPQPDEQGVFVRGGGTPQVVVPTAASAALATESISCVGEQVFSFIKSRLGEAPEDTEWSEKTLQLWLPLNLWVDAFFSTSRTIESLETLNALAATAHPRRLRIEQPDLYFHPDQFGRVCPIETPEGPNVVHIRHVATGAEIRDGRLVRTDDNPIGLFGISAGLIPFLEHSDRNRNLMGANMMRQWHTPPDPEPALVQTGGEPDIPGVWNGRNLLTAFILWDGHTYEDGLVVSESAAERLGYPCPLELGDKLSERHGVKGVIAQILPDDRMPHLSDGTPVELIYNALGLLTRFLMGPLKEAVMGRIARAEGIPARVPPFGAPSESDLKDRLKKNRLPEDGMETLIVDGKPLPNRSTVGWVYWGRTNHDANNKIGAVSHLTAEDIQAGRDSSDHKAVLPRTVAWPTAGRRITGQRQGTFEYWVLRDLGAYAYLLEQYNTRNDLTIYEESVNLSRTSLADRIAHGAVEPDTAPGPHYLDLQRRLRRAGIAVELVDESLRFRFTQPTSPLLKLAEPIPHPWIRERLIDEVGLPSDPTDVQELTGANERLATALTEKRPESLIVGTRRQLQETLTRYFDGLLHPSHQLLFPDSRLLFSGKGVLTPNPDLGHDQIGLPERMAWVLFGPFVAHEMGDWEPVRRRTPDARLTLLEVMKRHWVVVNSAPSAVLTTMLAFRPLCVPGSALQVHPFYSPLMERDFDGDQAAVFLPITEEAQEEVAERLSIAAHVGRDGSLLMTMNAGRNALQFDDDPTILSGLIDQSALWGLSHLSLTEEGRRRITRIVGTEIDLSIGYLTRAALDRVAVELYRQKGGISALNVLEHLQRVGFETARQSGASISPFLGHSLDHSNRPTSDDPKIWDHYADELFEKVLAKTDFDDPELGPIILAIKSGARGRPEHLRRWIGAAGHFVSNGDTLIPVKTSTSEGLSVEALQAEVYGAHRGIVQFQEQTALRGKEFRSTKMPKGFTVLARAIRSYNTRPGIVFARAAANEESDPLLDVDSRLLVGLRPR